MDSKESGFWTFVSLWHFLNQVSQEVKDEAVLTLLKKMREEALSNSLSAIPKDKETEEPYKTWLEEQKDSITALRGNTTTPKLTSGSILEVPLKDVNGVYMLPVKINGAVTLDFILDTGAKDSWPTPLLSLAMTKCCMALLDTLSCLPVVLSSGHSRRVDEITSKIVNKGDNVLKTARVIIQGHRNSLHGKIGYLLGKVTGNKDSISFLRVFFDFGSLEMWVGILLELPVFSGLAILAITPVLGLLKVES